MELPKPPLDKNEAELLLPVHKISVIGHRGAAGHAPENTRASFDFAIKMGVDAIETDVQRTVDGKIVLFHGHRDNMLSHTTNGIGVFDQAPWSVLSGLDAGSWFNTINPNRASPLFERQGILTLEDFLDEYGRRIPIEIEIKHGPNKKHAGLGVDTLKVVEEKGLIQTVGFTSYDFDSVASIKAANPQAKVGFLTDDLSDETLSKVLAAKMDQLCPNAASITKEFVDRCHSLGLNVRAFGIKSDELMQKALAAGVDGMTINSPDKLLRALGRSV